MVVGPAAPPPSAVPPFLLMLALLTPGCDGGVYEGPLDAGGAVDSATADSDRSVDAGPSGSDASGPAPDDPIPDGGETLPDPVDAGPIPGIHLCDEGLSDGDSIDALLRAHVADGATVVVCRGTYRLGSLSLSGRDWTVIAPEGATLLIQGNANLTLRGNGWRFSGFVFDQRASGAKLHLSPGGDDWQVDHCAWWGEHPGGSYLITPFVDSVDSTGVLDTLYMGDGQAAGTESGGIWVNANAPHRGTLYVRRLHIAHMIDNALYGTGPPTRGHPGRTNVEDSFFWSNTISNARTGALGGRECHVTGSVFVLDDTTRPCGVGCSRPGATTTRAVWAWYGPVRVEDNDFTIEHGQLFAETNGGDIRASGNRMGAAASREAPPGVPTSAMWILEHPPGRP